MRTFLNMTCLSMIVSTLTLSIFLLATPSSLQGATGLDPVGVFYKDDKVIILVNEDRGAPRLQSFFNSLEERGLLALPPQTKDRYVFNSHDQTARIQCARSEMTATCTFRFLPSSFATIADRRIEAFIRSEELFKSQTPVTPIQDFEMTFESSMKDLFHLRLTEKGLQIEAQKK